ncbi:MAG: hypothetical protein LBV17_12610 [Treponema sp.]|jgi:hypothetical protein|nr:hypothetical protein [Treponema sp.]
MKIENLPLFLVLVPHRDTRLVLRNYSAELFKAGLTGAYTFPGVAPLASLSRPLNKQELKNIAHEFRKSSRGAKFNAKEAYAMPFPRDKKNSLLFGLRFDFTIQPDLLNGAGNPFSAPVIGACLLSGGKKENALPCPPALSFSAAAVANMSWQSLNHAIGYKWEIGKLCWLPKKLAQTIP